jgi:hypothetical protein
MLIPFKKGTGAEEIKQERPTCYIFSNTFFNNQNVDSNGQSISKMIKAKGYDVTLYSNLNSTIQNMNSIYKEKQYKADILILNLGWGDYLNSSGIYSNESDSVYDAFTDLIKNAKEYNPDIKIYVIANQEYDIFEIKNNRGYDYSEYEKVIKKICENDNIEYINVSSEKISIGNETSTDFNILKGDYNAQKEVLQKIFN